MPATTTRDQERDALRRVRRVERLVLESRLEEQADPFFDDMAGHCEALLAMSVGREPAEFRRAAQRLQERCEHLRVAPPALRRARTAEVGKDLDALRRQLPALILVIDGDAQVRHMLAGVAAKAGYLAETAADGWQGLRTASECPPDLAFVDADLQDIDGYQLLGVLGGDERMAATPCILTSSDHDATVAEAAAAAGAAEFLRKPIAPDALAQRIERHLEAAHRRRQAGAAAAAERGERAGPESQIQRRFSVPRLLEVKQALISAASAPMDAAERFLAAPPTDLYPAVHKLGLEYDAVVREIARRMEVPVLEDERGFVPRQGVFPNRFCQTHGVVPLQDQTRDAIFAISNPFLPELLEVLSQAVPKGTNLRLLIADPRRIERLLHTRPDKDFKAANMDRLEEQLQQRYAQAGAGGEGACDEASEPVAQLVNELILQAHDMRASDIHIEPLEDGVQVRVRVDGHLRVVRRLQNPQLIRPLVGRIKIMAQMDVAERRLPQDGRITFRHFNQRGVDVDLRVATAPMQFGEKVVMRILEKHRKLLSLLDLGFNPRNLGVYMERIHSPYGMILHVGPTGSGKSMSLYAALATIRSSELNIQTIEDPIEYTLPGIQQLQVHSAIGLTFARVLRSFLRQNPDVVLVGEIRDAETAKVAVEASMTGHKLFSTLHTNDAASVPARLIDMGVEPFMVASSLLMVCAQRLLRRLCPQCRKPYEAVEHEKQLLGLPADQPCTLYLPVGCQACNGVGYKGRIGVHEILVPDDAMRREIGTGRFTSDGLRKHAVEACGMVTLFHDAMDKVRQGICCLTDVLARVRNESE